MSLLNPRVLAQVVVTSRAIDLTAQNFRTVASALPAGFYKVVIYANSRTQGDGLLAVTVAWTDNKGARSEVVLPSFDLNADAATWAEQPLYSNGSADVTVAADITVNAGAPTYDLFAVCMQLMGAS